MDRFCQSYCAVLLVLGVASRRYVPPMTALIGLGGIAAFLVLSTLLQKDPSALDRSLWALVLANAAFLYLWWLSALVFDLVYIWHRFICSYKTTAILSTLRGEAPSHLKA